MIDIAQDVLKYYLTYQKAPATSDIEIQDETLLEQSGTIFITLYKKGNIIGSAGNIKEIKASVIHEITENTISACNDERFTKPKLDEIQDIQIRIDEISDRFVLGEWELNNIDPTTHGVIVLQKDYSKMAVILPNIDPKLITGEDMIPVISAKLGQEKWSPSDSIIYKIDTKQTTNF